MASALQEALRVSRPKPHKCQATKSKNFIGNSEPFVPTT